MLLLSCFCSLSVLFCGLLLFDLSICLWFFLHSGAHGRSVTLIHELQHEVQDTKAALSQDVLKLQSNLAARGIFS
jgi:hypothetical protein